MILDMTDSAPAEPDDPMVRRSARSATEQPDHRVVAETLGGIYDGFEAYRTPTESDYATLLTSGMIVLDTNVLIDLYRYHKQTRDEFLLVLDNIKERLWFPHQVIKEF